MPAPAAPDLWVETISDYQSLLGLEPVWNDLLEAAGIDHPFVTHAWVRTWWECFGAGKELHILVVKAGEEAIAIAPLMQSRGRIYGIKVRRLQSISNDHTPRYDFIVARWPKEVYRAIWSYLFNHRSRWDVLQLCQLPAASTTLEELPRLAAGNGLRIGLWHSADSPYLPLVGTWDHYFKGLDGKHRANLRNRLKRLHLLGPVEVEVVSAGEQLGSVLQEGLRIEAAAWKAKAGTAILSRFEDRLFYARLAQRAAERGWLRLEFLVAARRRIAFAYALCYGNKVYLLKDGYDPLYAQYSPFNLLCYMALQDAMQRRMVEYDFLGEDETWKWKWTRETRPHDWLFVFSNALRARLLYSAKFRLIPRLKRKRLYVVARDAVVGLRKRFKIYREGG